MKKDYEVIVVGAGSSGAITAALLARHGHDVLLLDKQNFPRDKVCGDGVPSGVMETLYSIGMKDKLEKAIARGEFYPLTHMSIISPKGHQLILPLEKSENGFNPCIAPRFYFDALIQQFAIEEGAHFHRLKVKKPLVEKEQVVGVEAEEEDKNNSFNIRAQIVVGADGVTSAITRVLRSRIRHGERHRALSIRAYIEGIDTVPHQSEIYLYRNILPGYAWIFPTGGDRANIGLGMRLDYYRKTGRNLKAMLKEFLAMPKISNRLKPGWKLHNLASWPLNFGSQQYLQYAFNGALLVGDAAGFINPLTGGGIHRSLISGQLAAEVIHGALQRGNSSKSWLQKYEMHCRDQFLGELRHSYYLQNFLFHFPFLVDFLVSLSGGNSRLAKSFIQRKIPICRDGNDRNSPSRQERL